MVVRSGLATGGGARIIGGNYNLRHIKVLNNLGATSNRRYRIVRASTRRKGR